MSTPATSRGPLADLKVLELGQLIAGPFAAKLFAEFGAEVIKLEPPGTGDPLRQWRLLLEGTSLWWYVQARNKKSVTVDLRSPDGQEIARRLAREADIVVENFRPGTLEKWGLGYDALAAINPGLIMVRLSGFGQTGPYRDRPGFGAVGESMGGMRHVTGFPERPPVRMNISIGDALAALHGVVGALMALHHREARGGKGQVVDVALYEAVFNMMESLVPDYDLFGEIRGRIGTGLTNIVPSNTYTTRDGKSVVIAGNGDSIYKRLMHAIGRDDLGLDPDLANNVGRVRRTAPGSASPAPPGAAPGPGSGPRARSRAGARTVPRSPRARTGSGARRRAPGPGSAASRRAPGAAGGPAPPGSARGA